MNELLQKLSKLALPLAIQEGQSPTRIGYFEILKCSAPTNIAQGIVKPSFCVILQGTKKVLVGDQILRYGPGTYLASLIDIPAAGQVLTASKKEPYLGLRIEYSIEEITAVLNESKLNLKPERKAGAGAFTAKATEKVLETFLKLFELNQSSDPSEFLALLLKKELIYHLLCSNAGHLFARNVQLGPSDAGLGKAIHYIKSNYDQSFSIEDLAKNCHMSVSSLHHKFKAFTTMGPLQYQKHIRLQEARKLLMNGEEDDATSVAFRVGYESPSQFSREYRRLFGLPPMQDAKVLRQFEVRETQNL